VSRRKIGEALRQRLLQRAGHRCEYCQSHEDLLGDELQIDHIIPLVKGGTNDERNLCVACSRCNRNKSVQVSGIDPETGTGCALVQPAKAKVGKAFSLEQGWDAHHRSHLLWAGDSGSPEIERPKMGQIAPTLGLAQKTSAEAKNDSE
jgi:hypothetical protein